MFTQTFFFFWPTNETKGFPSDSDGKESACNAGDPGLILGLGRSPGEWNGYPFQYYCLENSDGQRSLAGYSTWGRKELDMTETITSMRENFFFPTFFG